MVGIIIQDTTTIGITVVCLLVQDVKELKHSMKKAIDALNSKTSSVEVQKDAKATNQSHFFLPTTETHTNFCCTSLYRKNRSPF